MDAGWIYTFGSCDQRNAPDRISCCWLYCYTGDRLSSLNVYARDGRRFYTQYAHSCYRICRWIHVYCPACRSFSVEQIVETSCFPRGECYFTGVDRKSTRLNSSHVKISYAVFCLEKKNHWS